MSIKDEIAKKYPALASALQRSKAAAIKLACVECMGGSGREARNCTQQDCYLWPHAWRSRRVAVAGAFETKEPRK